MNACEYVFLHAGGCLLESPDLDELSGPRGAYAWRWVATLWRDADQADGWQAMVWETAERGWWLPPALTYGDVVEFGASTLDADLEQHDVERWWGWVSRITPFAVVLSGPYVHPMRAYEAARPSVDELRLAQLGPLPAANEYVAFADTVE